MPPRAKAALREIAELRGVSILKIGNKCREARVFRARIEVAKRLIEIGYSSPRVGQILRHDHTTILYYIGVLNRKPSRPKWRTPTVKWLVEPPPAPQTAKPFLQPYAGWDPDDYKWVRRTITEESRP
jgi:hypothetical protein